MTKRNLRRCKWCGWQGTCRNCTDGDRVVEEYWQPPPIAEPMLEEVRGGLFGAMIMWCEPKNGTWDHLFTGPKDKT